VGFQRHNARVMAYMKEVCAILGWACLSFHGKKASSSEIWALIGSMVQEKSHLASSEKTPSKGMWVGRLSLSAQGGVVDMGRTPRQK